MIFAKNTLTEINNTYTQYSRKSYCFSLKMHLNQAPEIWLFNCSEGTQHNLLKYRIKLSLISKIFITDLTLSHIAGLPGLLSTLSLDSRSKTLHIYGPDKLCSYLKFNNKYSQTNFSYPVRVHNLKLHYTSFHASYMIRIISFENINQEIGYVITLRQILGKFNLLNAMRFNLNRGPLYGKLKQQNNFITPDGNEVQGKQFSTIYQQGQKITIMPIINHKTLIKELCWTTNYIIKT